jgi:hypothetical protein
MSIKKIVQAFTASLVVCLLACAQGISPQGASEDPESLRQMLARQPDYTAVRREFFLTEGSGGGMGLHGKEAKLGSKLAEVSEDVILIREPGKPTVKVFPKRKEYAEAPDEKKDDSGGPPEELTNPEKVARDGNVVFRSAGVEVVGGRSCLKIEVTHKNQKYKAMKLTFWVAPGLKNLVVQSEVAITRPPEGQVRFLTTFEDISLDVNEGLFQIPPGYRKVVEPDRPKGPGE